MTPDLLAGLEAVLGKERCLTAAEDRTAYSYDMFARGLPDLVVLPETTGEVSAVLALACQHKTPVTPRGAGTSLTGGPVPVNGGMVMAMTRMNRILEISVTDRLVRTQPGVVTADLQKQAAARGLYYPPNPTSADYCTIGGNIATNAGGASGVKYGVTADYIRGLTVVLADGRIMSTGGPCIKSVSGFDFKRALCGSEGLLGVITEACLKLIPAPAPPRTSLACFSTMEAAGEAVAAIIQNGLTPCCMELMDDRFLAAVSRVYGLSFPEGAGAALLVEFDDGPDRWPDQKNGSPPPVKAPFHWYRPKPNRTGQNSGRPEKGGPPPWSGRPDSCRPWILPYRFPALPGPSGASRRSPRTGTWKSCLSPMPGTAICTPW